MAATDGARSPGPDERDRDDDDGGRGERPDRCPALTLARAGPQSDIATADPPWRDLAVVLDEPAGSEWHARGVGVEHLHVGLPDRLGVPADRPDRGHEVAQLGDVVGRPALVVGSGLPQGGLGRREAQPAGRDRLGERERIDRVALAGSSVVAAHRSAPVGGRRSASRTATFLRPRWTRVRAVTEGMPMTVAMSAYSRSS